MSLYPPPPLRWDSPEARQALWRFWGRDVLRGGLDLAMHHGMRALPTDAASAIGARLGRRHGAGRPETGRTIRALFARLRPGATEEALRTMEGALWEHLGRTAAEFSALDRLWREGRIAVAGQENLHAARAGGRPLLFAGLHVGNWEAAHAGLTGLGLPVACFYQRLPSRFQMAVADRARKRTGIRMLDPLPSSAVLARRALDGGREAVLLYIDEYVGGRVHAPLLGRAPMAAGNIHRLVRLAALTGAAVLPVHAPRLEGARFRLEIAPEIPLFRQARDPAALAEDQARLDAVVEAAVRACPEQWLMATSFREDA